MVKANIKSMQVHKTSASINPHTEEASSITVHSLSHFKHFAIAPKILKSNLCNNSEIIAGSIIRATIIIAITPQEFFIKAILDVTVLNASFTVEPTMGIKLLIANFAVLIEILSVD